MQSIERRILKFKENLLSSDEFLTFNAHQYLWKERKLNFERIELISNLEKMTQLGILIESNISTFKSWTFILHIYFNIWVGSEFDWVKILMPFSIGSTRENISSIRIVDSLLWYVGKIDGIVFIYSISIFFFERFVIRKNKTRKWIQSDCQ